MAPPESPLRTDRWLVLAHEASNSGAPRLLLELLRGVRAARGPAWSCDILLGRGGPLTGALGDFGPVERLTHPWADGRRLVPRLLNRFVDRPLLQRRRLARWMAARRGSGAALIFANSATNGRWLPALRGLGRPIVTHAHELAASMRRFNSPAALAATLRCTDHFLAVSSAVAADLAALGVPRGRVTRVPNFLGELPPAADPAAARRALATRLELPEETRFITACGHIDRFKGPDLFIDLAEALAARGAPPFCLWLGGEHDRALARSLRRAVRSRGLGGCVRFAGAVEDPGPYFAGSEAVVVTSRVESFSRVALEAGAAGRPVLAFAAARGPADLLPADALVGELSGAAMAAAVAELLAHPEEARRRGWLLRERIAAEFMAAHWIGEVLAVTEALRHG